MNDGILMVRLSRKPEAANNLVVPMNVPDMIELFGGYHFSLGGRCLIFPFLTAITI